MDRCRFHGIKYVHVTICLDPLRISVTKIPASNFFERYLDTHYNDQKMKLIYPKAKKVH